MQTASLSDLVFFVVLMLTTTGLYRFVAPVVGVSIGQVSVVLFALTLLYVVLKIRSFALVIMRPVVLVWGIFLVVWPLASLSYALHVEMREVGLLLYYFLLFCATIVFVVGNDLHLTRLLITFSFFITIVGVAVSLQFPEVLESVAALAEAETYDQGRPFGFYMEPNKLATAIVLLFITWFALWRRKDTILAPFAILAFLALTLVTGSRTGVVLAGLLLMLILSHRFSVRILSGRYLLRVCVLVMCGIAGMMAANRYLSDSTRTSQGMNDLNNRMENLLKFKLTSEQSVVDDLSVQRRFQTQSVYVELIGEKPLLGYGIGADTFYKDDGTIFRSAHSELLSSSLELGIFYPLAFMILVWHLYWRAARRRMARYFGSNSVLQLALVLALLFTVYGDLLELRVFYVVLGVFVSCVYFPNFVLRRGTIYEESSSEPPIAGHKSGLPVVATSNVM